jgi:hypothetical protein
MQPQARDCLRGEPQKKYGYVPSTKKRGLTRYMYSLCAERQDYHKEHVAEDLSLMMLLYHSYERRCREPRDRIYSMLSLAKTSVPGTRFP